MAKRPRHWRVVFGFASPREATPPAGSATSVPAYCIAEVIGVALSGLEVGSMRLLSANDCRQQIRDAPQMTLVRLLLDRCVGIMMLCSRLL